MAKQRIDFEHGGPITGDSGERGDGVEGIDSIKPNEDGESAVAANFNRPEENMRQRSERLREAGENQMYLQDQMRWAITAGRADGEANTEPYPAVVNWNSTTGVFETTENLVVQSINTPKEDKQETKQWGFPTIGPATAWLDIFPRSDKRAYNHANLIKVVWLEAPTAEIVGGFCEAAVTGDPLHILEITVRDDALTQVQHVQNALVAISGDLVTAGIDYSVTGDVATYIDYSTIILKEYEFSGTFERELHYITPAIFASFFASKSLVDGDTLAIWFEELVEDGGTDGRRQAVPSNSNTSVGPSGVGELFNTSEYPERIPLSIPLCKRIGDDLFWLDGTVVLGSQTFPVFFGENGKTIERLTGAGISIAAHTNDGKPPRYSEDRWDIPADILQNVLEDLQAFVNNKASLQSDEDVIGNWDFEGNIDFEGEVEFQDKTTFSDEIWYSNVTAAYRSAFGDTNYHLVYNSTDGLTDWDTINIYEGQRPGIVNYPARLIVLGGTFDNGTGFITAAPDGAGSGRVSVVLQAGGTVGNHEMLSPSVPVGPTGLNILSASGWESWRNIGNLGQRFYVDTGKEIRFDGAGNTVFDHLIELTANATITKDEDATAGDYVLIGRFGADQPISLRLYYCRRSGGIGVGAESTAFCITSNCYWNGSVWLPDDAARNSRMVAFGYNSTDILIKDTDDPSPLGWSDTVEAIPGNGWTTRIRTANPPLLVTKEAFAYDLVEGSYVDTIRVSGSVAAPNAWNVPQGNPSHMAAGTWHRKLGGAGDTLEVSIGFPVASQFFNWNTVTGVDTIGVWIQGAGIGIGIGGQQWGYSVVPVTINHSV